MRPYIICSILLFNGFRGEDVVSGLAASLGVSGVTHGHREAGVVVPARLVLRNEDEKKERRVARGGGRRFERERGRIRGGIHFVRKDENTGDCTSSARPRAASERDGTRHELTPSAKILKMALTVSLISSTGRSSPPLPFAASRLVTSPSISATRLLRRDCWSCRLAMRDETSSRAHSPPAHASASLRIESISADDIRLRPHPGGDFGGGGGDGGDGGDGDGISGGTWRGEKAENGDGSSERTAVLVGGRDGANASEDEAQNAAAMARVRSIIILLLLSVIFEFVDVRNAELWRFVCAIW